jgi:hypothetical protein
MVVAAYVDAHSISDDARALSVWMPLLSADPVLRWIGRQRSVPNRDDPHRVDPDLMEDPRGCDDDLAEW